MILFDTGALHQTSSVPLRVQEYPQKGVTLMTWRPGDGHSYSVIFVQLEPLAELCIGMTSGCVYVTLIDALPEGFEGETMSSDVRTWSGVLPTGRSFSDTLLRKRFGVQGRRLHALSALVHLAFPGGDKARGYEKALKLVADDTKKTVH